MADKLMAENLGLKFYTPEQFFLGHSITNVPMNKPDFDPKELTPTPFNENLLSKAKEVRKKQVYAVFFCRPYTFIIIIIYFLNLSDSRLSGVPWQWKVISGETN